MSEENDSTQLDTYKRDSKHNNILIKPNHNRRVKIPTWNNYQLRYDGSADKAIRSNKQNQKYRNFDNNIRFDLQKLVRRPSRY